MGYGYMQSAGAMGGWGMAFGGVMMIFWLVILIAAIVFLVRLLNGAQPLTLGGKDKASPALARLQERYANGDIDSAEYEERAQKLKEV